MGGSWDHIGARTGIEAAFWDVIMFWRWCWASWGESAAITKKGQPRVSRVDRRAIDAVLGCFAGGLKNYGMEGHGSIYTSFLSFYVIDSRLLILINESALLTTNELHNLSGLTRNKFLNLDRWMKICLCFR